MPFFTSKDKNSNDLSGHILFSLIDRKIRENLMYQAINDQISKAKYLKEKSQDGNTSSNVSTISDEDHKTNSSISNNDKKFMNDKEDMNDLLKSATEDVTNYFNLYDCFVKPPSNACHYYCNLTNMDREERYLSYKDSVIKDFIVTYETICDKKEVNEI